MTSFQSDGRLTSNNLCRLVEEIFRTEDAPVASVPSFSYWSQFNMSGLY